MKSSRKWGIYFVALAVVALGLNTGWADDDDDHQPGKAVMQAVKNLFPSGKVMETESDHLMIRVYEVEVSVDGKVMDVAVLADGTVLSVEEEVAVEDLPPAVAGKVEQLINGGKDAELEKIKHMAELKVVKVDPSRIEYEVEARVNGKWRHARFAQDGSQVQDPHGLSDDDGDEDEMYGDDDEGDDDDEDDDDD